MKNVLSFQFFSFIIVINIVSSDNNSSKHMYLQYKLIADDSVIKVSSGDANFFWLSTDPPFLDYIPIFSNNFHLVKLGNQVTVTVYDHYGECFLIPEIRLNEFTLKYNNKTNNLWECGNRTNASGYEEQFSDCNLNPQKLTCNIDTKVGNKVSGEYDFIFNIPPSIEVLCDIATSTNPVFYFIHEHQDWSVAYNDYITIDLSQNNTENEFVTIKENSDLDFDKFLLNFRIVWDGILKGKLYVLLSTPSVSRKTIITKNYQKLVPIIIIG